MKNRFLTIVGFVILLLWLILGVSYVTTAKQLQPDPKRIREIQAALVDHNYAAGKTWHETQEILRGIARNHKWQVRYAPDARVLILLDLGNKYSDPEVALEGHNHLDGGSNE